MASISRAVSHHRSTWKTFKLGQLLRRLRKPVEVKADQTYREIGIFSHGKGIFYKEGRTGASLGNKRVYWIEPDCFVVNIVFAWEQAIAKTTSAEKGMIASHRFPMYKPIEGKLDLDYLVYFFKTPKGKHLLGLASPGGAGRNKTLGQQAFLDLEIPLPPLVEQCKIADILSTGDEAVTLTERLIEAKQRRKKALMQQLFTGRQRFKEFEDAGTQHTRYGRIPADWAVLSLNSLVKPITRMEGVALNKEYRRVGVRWYVQGAHIHSILPGSQIATKTLSRVEEHDILYNKMWASKAAFAIARTRHHGAYGTTEYPQFRAPPERLSVDFLEYVFHLPRFLYDATTLCRGTTSRARLNPRDFLRIEIPVPPLAEQRKIAAVLQDCDEEIDLLELKLAALKQQKKGLMQQLLTGRVKVKV